MLGTRKIQFMTRIKFALLTSTLSSAFLVKAHLRFSNITRIWGSAEIASAILFSTLLLSVSRMITWFGIMQNKSSSCQESGHAVRFINTTCLAMQLLSSFVPFVVFHFWSQKLQHRYCIETSGYCSV